MKFLRRCALVNLLAAFLMQPALSAEFSFSQAEANDQANDDAVAERVRELVAAPCRQKLKKQKIMVLIAERTNDGWNASQERYGPHFQAINSRLRALGLSTYTKEEIRAQIAQAEIDAYFKNDPDAALAASKRLGANYILRGDISTQVGYNPVVRLNDVALNVDLTLSAASGRILSNVSAHSESYSGSNTLQMSLILVKEQGDQLVAQLYNDYCHNAVSQTP